MYVATVPNRGSPPAILLRESYREDGKIKNRTLANLSDWPANGSNSSAPRCVATSSSRSAAMASKSAAPSRMATSSPPSPSPGASASTTCCPAERRSARRDLALALIVARLLDPAAKLATARMLDTATASHSLGETLGLGSVTAREIYTTLDWLGSEQSFIENRLARRHLKNGTLVLYDVTSTYLEGRCCPLAQPRLQPRQPRRPAATGDRPAVCRGWLSGRGRGVRRQYRRSGDRRQPRSPS